MMSPSMNPRRGAVLVLTVLLLLFLGTLAAGFILASTTDLQTALHHRTRTTVLHAAMGGVELGFQRLVDVPDPDCSRTEQFSVAIGGTSTEVTLAPDPHNNCADSTSGWHYDIRSRAGIALGTEQEVRVTAMAVRNTYAGFCYWWQRSEPSWWSEYDIITGPAFVNGANLYLLNNPADPRTGASWYGPVTLAGSGEFVTQGVGVPGDPSTFATFHMGYETGASLMDFPPSIAAALNNAGLTLFGTTQLILVDDGTMRVWNYREGYEDDIVVLPTSGVIWVRNGGLGMGPGNVDLSGTLRGRLTIIAEGNVRIVGDVRYARDPRFEPSTDMLGIISGSDGTGRGMIGDINPAGPDNDVQVFGFLMSLGTCPLSEWCGALDVENLRNRPYEGTLITYGGQISDRLSATIISGPRGFSSDATYDRRGLTSPPPFFPSVEAEGSRWNIVRADTSWTQIFDS